MSNTENDGERYERNVSHVGPIVFSNDTAREQLEEYGEVVTFRPDDRTTGDTWWRMSRTGEKEGDVHVAFAGHVCPHGTGSGLKPHVDKSGFDSVGDWQAAIRSLHGGMPSEGALYRVTEGHNAE